MASQTLKYTVTPDQYAKIAALLSARGFKTNGNSGEIKEFGADVQFLYDSTLGTLTLTVLSPPHFHSMEGFCSQVDAGIKAELAQ